MGKELGNDTGELLEGWHFCKVCSAHSGMTPHLWWSVCPLPGTGWPPFWEIHVLPLGRRRRAEGSYTTAVSPSHCTGAYFVLMLGMPQQANRVEVNSWVLLEVRLKAAGSKCECPLAPSDEAELWQAQNRH